MSNFCWLDVSVINFNALLLFKPLPNEYSSLHQSDETKRTVLKVHPVVRRHMEQIHPPDCEYIDQCLALTKEGTTQKELRRAEIAVPNCIQDWLMFVIEPEKYEQHEYLN